MNQLDRIIKMSDGIIIQGSEQYKRWGTPFNTRQWRLFIF